MPEMYFQIQWPDGQQENCYSPSTVISNYLTSGKTYPLADFVRQVDLGLTAASERVREKFGYYCSSAADQLQLIRSKAETFQNQPNARVTVKAIR